MPKVIAKRRAGGTRKDPRKGVKRESYNVPDELDIQLLNNKIEKFKKSLNPDGSPKKGVTVNDIKRMVRKVVREEWMRCDTKLAFLNSQKIPDTNPSTRTRFRIPCNHCGESFKETDIEVDHKDGHKTFTNVDDILEWARAILDVSFEDLQCLCIDCHKLKSRAEMAGVSLEEAAILLMMDEICRGAGCPEKLWLEGRGISPASNKDLRKQQVIDYLTEERDKNDGII